MVDCMGFLPAPPAMIAESNNLGAATSQGEEEVKITNPFARLQAEAGR